MIHIGLFEGIGGFSIAAKAAGWHTLATCEINPFGQQVLKYYWPDAYYHGDIKTLTYDTINDELSARFGRNWRDQPVIITGGFPCQPYSLAGKRLGKEDDRHLWPEMLRIIREVSPEWVVGENVFGLVNWNGGLVFDEVQADLEAAGYEVQPFILPACGVNAPHKRERVWFIAHRANARAETMQEWENSIYVNKVTANSNHHGSHGPQDGQGNYQGYENSPSGAHAAFKPSGCCGETVDTNPASKPSEWHGLEQCEVGEQEQVKFRGNSSRMDNGGIDANPDNEGLEGGEWGCAHGEWNRAQAHGSTAKCVEIPAWDRWPTQSPVCGGDDGVPAGLVGITVSKHRNESLKAYGNAIVPQVVYQIFKAINYFE